MQARVPSAEAVLRVRAGCALRCTFCTRSPHRVGDPLDHFLSRDFTPPAARRVLIIGGDLLRPQLVPLVRKVREAGAEQVLAYGHSGQSDLRALRPLAAAGLTGLFVSVPAADRETLLRLTRGTGSLRRLADLFDAAGDAGLSVEVEVPLLEDNHAAVPDTVRRVLKRARRVDAVHIAPGAAAARGTPRPWDFRDAATDVAAAIAVAAEAGVPVRLASPPPPPCILDVAGATPALYPDIDAASGGRRMGEGAGPFAACAACALAGRCHPVPGFAPAPGRPIEPLSSDTVLAAAPSSAEILVRRSQVADLIEALAGARIACASPWTVLAAHNPRGGVAPCRGSMLRPEVYAATGNWVEQPLLDVWNSDGMRAVRRAIADGRPQSACRPDCPVFFGAPHMAELAPRLPSTPAGRENLVLKLKEVLEGADLLRSRPTCLVVSPSLRCNNRCRMCPVHDEALPITDMPEAVYRSVLELIPTLRDLSFAGAEPLVSSRFAGLVRACDASIHPDLGLSLTTNGLLLSGPLLADMARARFHTVVVSINAASPATYEWISGQPGGFDRVVRNVTDLLRAARGWRHPPAVILSFVLMRSNRHEVGPFLDLAARLGTGFRLLPVERDRSGESIFTDPDVLEDAIRHVRDEALPRTAGLPEALADEVSLLLRRLEARRRAGGLAPL